MGMNGIFNNNYSVNAETVVYTNASDKSALILNMQVSRDASNASTISMWIADESNNKMGVYLPTNTPLEAYEVISDTDKHIVPPGHKIVFKCSHAGNYIELAIYEGLD